MQLEENIGHSNMSHYSQKDRSKVAKDTGLKAVKRASHQEAWHHCITPYIPLDSIMSHGTTMSPDPLRWCHGPAWCIKTCMAMHLVTVVQNLIGIELKHDILWNLVPQQLYVFKSAPWHTYKKLDHTEGPGKVIFCFLFFWGARGHYICRQDWAPGTPSFYQ